MQCARTWHTHAPHHVHKCYKCSHKLRVHTEGLTLLFAFSLAFWIKNCCTYHPGSGNLHGGHTTQAADSCAETCIGNNFNDSEMVNACMRRCERSLPLINQTVQQELTNLQVRTTAWEPCFEIVGDGGSRTYVRSIEQEHLVLWYQVAFYRGVRGDTKAMKMRELRTGFALMSQWPVQFEGPTLWCASLARETPVWPCPGWC